MASPTRRPGAADAGSLPIAEILEPLRAALAERGSAVVAAPPGAGKTTRVPLALLEEPWLAGKRMILLEPRRLAARAAASHMASLLGEAAGETVGYRTRLDSRVSARTQIEVVTEGILTRMLQDDPALEGTGLVLFDEFHERSIHADLGLALTLDSRAVLRPDLRILVMSATLETEAVSKVLGNAPVLESAGRMYEVETHYLDRPRTNRVEDAVAAAIRRALDSETGDMLVFLPGAGEIGRTAERLQGVAAEVMPLFGNLSRDEQDRAIAPSAPGRRKVVLATSIAETSLTIEGIRVVIDGGLMRVPRFSPRTGMSRLETITVSRASADQRRGRAGRTGPGVCYRLWTRAEDAGLVERTTPEILSADLAPLALELSLWGARDPDRLAWIDLPPPAAWAQARSLLHDLEAIGRTGEITAFGRRMAALPAHPRLAHMLLHAASPGLQDNRRAQDGFPGRVPGVLTATRMAALLEERDILRGDAYADPDIRLRLDILEDIHAGGGWSKRRQRSDIDAAGARRVLAAARQIERLLARQAHRMKDAPSMGDDDAGALLARAYPDRIAMRRQGAAGRFVVRNGRGVTVDPSSSLASADWLVIAATSGGTETDARAQLAAPIAETDVRRIFADAIETVETVQWDDAAGAVRARRIERLGALILSDVMLHDADPDLVARALAGKLAADGSALPWTAETRSLQARLTFLRRLDDAWPDVSDEALAASAERFLPWLTGMRSLRDVRSSLDLAGILTQSLDARQRRELDRLAPTHCTVPSGSNIRIDYSDPDAPVLAVRLQEVFGLAQTPRIGGDRVPLLMHLLSPAQRPVQVTRDLASFWASGYFEVRKDLRGRYPKHDWPEDPLKATPSRGPKRRRGPS